MKTMTLGEFYPVCMKMIDYVFQNRRSILITKGGNPILKIKPIPKKTLEKYYPKKTNSHKRTIRSAATNPK